MKSALQKLTRRYLDARDTYEDLNDQLHEARERMDRAEDDLLSAMNDAGLDQLRTEGGVSFSRARKLRYSCPAAQKGALLDRLEEDGYRELFNVPANALSALMKEMANVSPDGMLPERYADIVNEYEDFKLSVRGRGRR